MAANQHVGGAPERGVAADQTGIEAFLRRVGHGVLAVSARVGEVKVRKPAPPGSRARLDNAYTCRAGDAIDSCRLPRFMNLVIHKILVFFLIAGGSRIDA